MSNKTKNNHYVPKFYLKNFFNNQGILFEKNLESGRILERDIKTIAKVGSKKNLYTIKELEKITNEDIEKCIRLFTKHKNIEEIDYKHLLLLKNFLNDEIGLLLNNTLGKYTHKNKDFEDIVNKLITETNNIGTSRTQEDLYSFYETRFLPVYNGILKSNKLSLLQESEEPMKRFNYKLYNYLQLNLYFYNFTYHKLMVEASKSCNTIKKAKSDLYKSERELIKYSFFDFVGYMFIQSFRTKKMITELESVLPKNVYFLYNHIVANVLANQCITQGYKLVLIKNDTNISFITSDIPVINIYNEINQKEGLGLYELYYPLSNNLSVLFTDKKCYKNNEIIINENQVNYFNECMIKSAYNYIYSSDQELLNDISR
ncbi:hypothetical protein LO80_09620 [Candidatus Francisella endociliophora]|uniref:DUF4238 domain-containing protein n=1 Tax=Candidatus Francisella endociliophora TaxID=653937 RepID=A0A097ERN3_9GAMM|nr:DUF4238 domain-containing protein [Francisella sp. FSC1006]AIT10202.1 hypothetical protein LO80_09620 [Francisella sp. FSC1006]